MISNQPTFCPLSAIQSLGKRLGIFGGSFDPVHNGHIELAKLAKSALKLDAVIFIPANQNPLKPNAPVANNKARLEMLELALKDQEGLFFSDLECSDVLGLSYSVDTLRRIRAEYSSEKIELFFLIGTDQIHSLHLWKDYKELFQLAQIVVFGRGAVSSSEFSSINPRIEATELKELCLNYIEFKCPFSSTEIRASLAIKDFEQVRELMPKALFENLIRTNLYGGK